MIQITCWYYGITISPQFVNNVRRLVAEITTTENTPINECDVVWRPIVNHSDTKGAPVFQLEIKLVSMQKCKASILGEVPTLREEILSLESFPFGVSKTKPFLLFEFVEGVFV